MVVQIEELEAPIEVTVKTNNAQGNIKKFARDVKKELNPALLQKLELNVVEFQRKLDRARQALKIAKKQWDVDAEIKARLNVNRLRSDTTEAKRLLRNYTNTGEKEVSRLSSLFGGLWKQIKNSLTWLLGVGAIFSVVRWIQSFFKTTAEDAIKLESAFTGVIKTVDWSEESIKALRNELNSLAWRVPVVIEELFKIAELWGQLWVPIQDITKFTETIAQIAWTTNLTAEQAATSFARIANVVWLPLSEVDKLASVVVELGNNFATTEAEIVLFTQRLSAAGTIAWVTPQSLAAIATALSSVGVNAQAWWTALSKAFIDINSAINGWWKDLELLAKISWKTKDEFIKDREIDAWSSFADFVDWLKKKWDDATEVIDELFGANIRTRNAFLSLALASDTLRDAISKANTEIDIWTALQEEFAKRVATTESQLQLMENRLRVARAEVGDTTKSFNLFWAIIQLWAINAVVGIQNSFAKLQAWLNRFFANTTLKFLSLIEWVVNLWDSIWLIGWAKADKAFSNLEKFSNNARKILAENSKEVVNATIEERKAVAVLQAQIEENAEEQDNLAKSWIKSIESLTQKYDRLKKELDETTIWTEEFNDKFSELEQVAKEIEEQTWKTFWEFKKGLEETTEETEKLKKEAKSTFEDWINKQIKSTEDRIKSLIWEIQDLNDELGKIGEEKDQDIADRVVSIDVELEEARKKIEEFNQAIASSDWSDYQDIVDLQKDIAEQQQIINDLTTEKWEAFAWLSSEEADWLRELIEEQQKYNDLTEIGKIKEDYETQKAEIEANLVAKQDALIAEQEAIIQFQTIKNTLLEQGKIKEFKIANQLITKWNAVARARELWLWGSFGWVSWGWWDWGWWDNIGGDSTNTYNINVNWSWLSQSELTQAIQDALNWFNP